MKYKFLKSITLSATALGVVAVSGTQVFAQQNNTPSFELEEIIVTARKREETLQDVPIAITAFSAIKIENLGLENVLDLPKFTPGFVYEKFAGIPGRFDNSPRFRGVSVNSSLPNRQTASVFVDGVFVAGGVQGLGFTDIERVEIIKGPQSAYFGRNTFGGAVNYVTKTPSEEFSGKVSALAAERGQVGLDVSVEGGLTDWLRARVNASYKDKEGHYKNANGGDRLGDEETTGFGATLYIEPSDNFNAKIRYYTYEDDDGAPSYSFAGLPAHNCGPFTRGGITGTDSTICGVAPISSANLNTTVTPALLGTLARLEALFPRGNKTEFGLDREADRLSAQFDYKIGNITISGLFGSNDEEVRLLRDADDSSDVAFVSYSNRSFEEDSIELRVSGVALDDRLNWSVGFNDFESDFTNNGEFIVPAFGDFAFGGGEPGQEIVETQGIFASIDYAFSDSFSLVLEGRDQEDTVIADSDIRDTRPASVVEFDNFLPRAILKWSPSDDSLWYLSYSEGNLPGGFNGEVADLSASDLAVLRTITPGAETDFEEEKLENIELGWKGTVWDGRGQFSAAVYKMDRTNQTFRRADVIPDPTSRTGFNQVDFFINAGKSDITGAELEGRFAVNDIFTIEATLAYVKSEFKVFESGPVGEVFGSTNAAGARGDRFPEFSGSLSAVFNGQLNSNLDWFARADVFYQDERFASEINLTTADSGSQVDLRAGVSNDRYRVEVFLKNATDDDTPTAINRFRDLSFNTPLFDFSTLGYQTGLRDRRQVGVRASYNF